MVVIVGGGISGLSAAYYLSKAGIAATIVEKQPRLGGVIQTERIDGCLVEGGPDSFLAAKPWAMDLIRELGLANEVVGSNDHLRKTFIRKRGRLVPMPDGVQFLVPTRIAPLLTTPLLSWRTKARMGLEWFRSPPAATRPDCSVAAFVKDHYGQEAVDYLAEPLLAGVYGGAPETLSVASVLPRFVEMESNYGSLSKGMLAERTPGAAPAQSIFRTMKGGLGTLVGALAAKATVIHSEVEALERVAGGYRLRVAGDWIAAAAVVLACESHAAARPGACRRSGANRLPGRHSLQLLDCDRHGLRSGQLLEAARRLRISGPSEGAPAPGGLHFHGDEVPLPRPARPRSAALLCEWRRRG